MNLDDLLAERDIQHTLFAIARAMDERDWARLDELLLPDAEADLGRGRVVGRAAIVAFLRSFLDDCGPTQHLIGNVVVAVSGDIAESRAYVSDMHLGRGEKAGREFFTLGEYLDTWRRTPEGWRLARRVKRHGGFSGDMGVLGPGSGPSPAS